MCYKVGERGSFLIDTKPKRLIRGVSTLEFPSQIMSISGVKNNRKRNMKLCREVSKSELWALSETRQFFCVVVFRLCWRDHRVKLWLRRVYELSLVCNPEKHRDVARYAFIEGTSRLRLLDGEALHPVDIWSHTMSCYTCSQDFCEET